MLIALKRFLWAKQHLTALKNMSIFSYSLLQKMFKLRRSSLRFLFLIKIVYNIVQAPLFLKRGKVDFDYLPRRGEYEKLEKGGGSMVKGQVGWNFSYLIFWRFIIFTFRNYITLCKIVLCIWRKTIFFSHHNFIKMFILSCRKWT